MKRACLSLLLVCAASSTTGWSLEGTLNKDKKEAAQGGDWTFEGAGAWTVNNIISCYNQYEGVKNRCKIGVDPKVGAKSVTDFKVVPGITIVAGMEKLAKAVGAKLYAINGNFLYIANDLPAGFPPPGGVKEPAPQAPAVKPGPAVPVSAPASAVGMTSLPVTFPWCQAGWSSVIPWSRVNFDDCKKDPRPKVLFIIDDDTRIEANNTAHFFEALLLEDPECVAALKGFEFIKINASDRTMNWPENMLEAARMPEAVKTVPKPAKPPPKDAKPVVNPASSACTKGASLYLLRPDCSPTQIAWSDRSPQLTARLVVDAARGLLPKAAPPPPPPAVADKGNAADPAKPPAVDKPPEKPKKKAGPDEE